MKKYILAITAVSLIALAGCSESETGGNTAAAVEGAVSKIDQTLASSMTPQQKAAAVNEARSAAESAAKAAGQSDALVQQAGDAAAMEAKKALGVQ
ncbi:hypothetical protein GCM10011491_26770 [Brucella endophytica]|uniref:Antifreeze protein n=1 Tax=Brucella endophytica TaxID=1963359 RepID=A0A916SH31_9HYPH|nr:hypothetical protein [Brucella endophytica]GGA97116.1 hypothetical protein GCM10011491_26770 [Brucella endophytica]